MKPRKDFITEEEYTRRMIPLSTNPENDSPDDSETDAGLEFQMGLDYYAPAETDDDEELDLQESVVADDDRRDADLRAKNKIELDELPDSAKAISSEQPAPWKDLEKTSDTN